MHNIIKDSAEADAEDVCGPCETRSARMPAFTMPIKFIKK